MRPVNRGGWPTDLNGNDIKYKEYAKARGELINRLGEFCSYCEMHLDTSLAVEHVQPKKPDGATVVMVDRELDWNNFLLACTNCNSTKGNTDVLIDDYYWPDRDNTYRALQYSVGGIVEPAAHLSIDQKKLAEATIKLTGLDRCPLNDPEASDRRWKNRRETWDIAVRSKKNLLSCNQSEMREQIVLTAIGQGYWSVWMTVFKQDTDMLLRFIGALPGTCLQCFDAANQYSPIARHGGQI
jgi:uncharacterized protein (TIGR02646 family)